MHVYIYIYTYIWKQLCGLEWLTLWMRGSEREEEKRAVQIKGWVLDTFYLSWNRFTKHSAGHCPHSLSSLPLLKRSPHCLRDGSESPVLSESTGFARVCLHAFALTFLVCLLRTLASVGSMYWGCCTSFRQNGPPCTHVCMKPVHKLKHLNSLWVVCLLKPRMHFSTSCICIWWGIMQEHGKI